MPIQCCLGIYVDFRDGVRGACSAFSSQEDEQQGNHGVDSHLLPEFSTSSTDLYLLKGEWNGKRQLINHQVANSASAVEKPQYLLNVTLRDLFLSEVLVHKQQCIQIPHAPIQQLIWHSWINLV